MRQLISPISYLAALARDLAKGWDRFWFTPADPTSLGLIRILTGLMLLYTHAVWGLALDDFFGTEPWLSEPIVRAIQADQYAYSFWWLVPPQWAWDVHVASLGVLALFTVGYKTRVTSVLALVVAISYAHRVPEALFGLDQINVMLTLYLTVGGAGQALSVDRWLDTRRRARPASGPHPSAAANIGLRLINVHMCVIYLFAGISKLQGEAWWDGQAMWGAFANLEYQSADMTWLARHPRLIDLATHICVLWEMTFCVLVWKPRWRPLVLAGAVALHLGIGACLGMWTFGLIMLVGCVSFLPDETVHATLDALSPIRSRREPAPLGLFRAHRGNRLEVPELAGSPDCE
jgi:uncharacterized membrane protein YphA (DoxX/SURF4 family)